MKPGLIFQWK